jgi:hypothetical protein
MCYLQAAHARGSARGVCTKERSIFFIRNSMHQSAGPMAAGRGNFYLLVKDWDRIAAKLRKGTAESPKISAAGIPNMM